MHQQMQISIVIPTYKRLEILKETYNVLLKSIKNIKAEIIIVNDDSFTSVETIAKTIGVNNDNTFVINNYGKGVASARNSGAKMANADMILFIDDDILVSQSNILNAIKLYQLNSKASYNFNWTLPDEIIEKLKTTSFGRFLIYNKLTDYKGWVTDIKWEDNSLISVHKLAAFFFVIDKNIFLDIGGFKESFERQGVEDDELSMRLINSGHKLYIKTGEYVLHNEIDRHDLIPRLKRINAGAINKRYGYDLGLVEYQITYSTPKLVALYCLLPFRKFLLKLLYYFPNNPILDKIYFTGVNIMILITIYFGFVKRKMIFS